MRERIKTLVLLILVLTSIGLTGRLLFGQPALETAALPAYEQLVFGEMRPVTEQNLPTLRLQEVEEKEEEEEEEKETTWRILFPWDNEHRQAWGLMLDLMRISELPQQQEEAPELTGRVVTAEFAVPATPGLWLSSAASADLQITEAAWLAAEPEYIWYRDVAGEWLKGQLPALPPEWESETVETFSQAAVYVASEAESWEALNLPEEEVILLPGEMPVLAAYATVPEELDAEKLLRSIFVDTALVRRIEERDGAFIYTDGQRGLRFFSRGELEYSSPNSEPGQEPLELSQILRETAQYLQLMGGWPDHLHLNQLEEAPQLSWDRRQQRTYSLSMFSVQHGVPLITPQPPVSLRLSDRGVIHYNRQITLLDNPVGQESRLLDPRELAETVAERLEADHGGARLVDIYPAYFVGRAAGQSTAHPVWTFSFSGNKKAVMHGHTGRFLTWIEEEQ
ncbi:two-component system activity regulator YycH [Dethiobacter alkaliphilus]|uniref:Regulatory protein YycH domain-containing protein n=1 Tax=Dethiobacter alkaliphilus AHT 1 TaxID=555088 RepID=C0GIA4_DETAL|nr:two-component system activity regulator YycH [Dethiobacter alkaliphilus]EEG76952.1 hypothetical protein DealDRAFT_2213 [Dethiobacter alkaliphilus AHT 1]